MKKPLVCLSLVVALCFVFASPVSASGPPERISYDNEPIVFSEDFGVFTISVVGVGSFNGQIVRPNGKATEESWFEVTNFNSVAIDPYPGGLYLGDTLLFDGSASDIKIMVHNGGQSNQPIFTLHSSDPIHLYEIPSPFGGPPILQDGYYTLLQFQGLDLIHAK